MIRRLNKTNCVLLLLNTIIFSCICFELFFSNGYDEESHQVKMKALVETRNEIDPEEDPVETEERKRVPEFGFKDASGKYFMHPYYWRANNWTGVIADAKICVAMQTSINGIFWVTQQAAKWNGPLSVAVYAPGKDMELTSVMIKYLKRCFPPIRERMSFHLVYPVDDPAEIVESTIYTDKLSCNDPEAVNNYLLTLRSDEREEDHLYPQNIMRNTARRGCPTEYATTVDVDMIFVPKMYESMQEFLSTKPCDTCIFVLPVYEIHSTVVEFPKDKCALIELTKKFQARQFHSKIYDKNQKNSNLGKWISSTCEMSYSDPPKFEVMYTIKDYMEFWEPPVILRSDFPGFDERFVGYGFTRSSHIFELWAKDYTFMMLDKPFLSHRGFQNKKHYPEWRRAQIRENRIRYEAFKRGLLASLQKEMPVEEPDPNNDPEGLDNK